MDTDTDMDTDMVQTPAKKPLERSVPRRPAPPSGPLKTALALAVTAAVAVPAVVHAQTLRIEPTLQTQLTYTDNVAASENGGGIGADADVTKRGDWIAEVTPGIALRRSGGRLNGFLNAQLRSLSYADETQRNTTFLALSGNGEYEAIENMLFLRANAQISRDNGSLLTGSGGPLDVAKDNETRTLSLGPRLRLQPFGTAELLAQYERRWFDGEGETAQRDQDKLDLSLADENAFGAFGWGLSFAREESSSDQPDIDDVLRQTATVDLYYSISPQLRLRAGLGRESNRFDEVEGRSSDTYSNAGLDWSPSPRTSLSATVEDRFFGTGYAFNLDHRRARSAWSLRAQRAVGSVLDDVPGLSEDLLFQQYFDALGSIADPLQRELEARRLAQEQIANGGTRFVSNSYFLSQTITASVALIGKRSRVSLSATQGKRTRLGQVTFFDGRDDLARYDTVTDRALSASLSHKLTPQTSGTLTLTRSRAEGQGAADNDQTDRTLVSLGLSTRLGENATGGVVVRHQRADGTANAADFTENSVSANLGIRF